MQGSGAAGYAGRGRRRRRGPVWVGDGDGGEGRWGRGEVEGAAGVRWRSGVAGEGCGVVGQPATGSAAAARVWVGTNERVGRRDGAGRPLTYPPLCRQPTVGKEVGPVGLSWLNNNWTHPPLCRLLADGKDSLPSASRRQRTG